MDFLHYKSQRLHPFFLGHRGGEGDGKGGWRMWIVGWWERRRRSKKDDKNNDGMVREETQV